MQRHIKPIFKQYFNNEKNFCTPIIYGYDIIKMKDKWIVIEKSRNRECTSYGVTTLLYIVSSGKTQRIDLSKWCESAKEANKYIKKLRGEINEIEKKIDEEYSFIYGEEKQIFI